MQVHKPCCCGGSRGFVGKRFDHILRDPYAREAGLASQHGCPSQPGIPNIAAQCVPTVHFWGEESCGLTAGILGSV